MYEIQKSLMPRVVLVAVAGVIFGALPVLAHDFWLVPNALEFAPGSPLAIEAVTGTRFPVSQSATAADRIADARILGAAPAADEALRDFTVAGKSLLIRHRSATNGQRVVAMSLAPGTRRMAGEAFGRYLRLEGAGAIADGYEKQGRLPKDSIVMRSTKYAKTLVEVGRGGACAFGRVVQQALEFVPLTDPAGARPSDTLALRIVANGKPLAGASVHAGRAPYERETAQPELTLIAGTDGIVQLPLSADGLWNVRTANAETGAQPATWDVAWATFVFALPGKNSTVTTGDRVLRLRRSSVWHLTAEPSVHA